MRPAAVWAMAPTEVCGRPSAVRHASVAYCEIIVRGLSAQETAGDASSQHSATPAELRHMAMCERMDPQQLCTVREVTGSESAPKLDRRYPGARLTDSEQLLYPFIRLYG